MKINIIIQWLVVFVIYTHIAIADDNMEKNSSFNLTISPTNPFINEITEVTYKTYITKLPTEVVDRVRIVQTDTNGNILVEIGDMLDDGLNGDIEAGDSRYRFSLSINESIPAIKHYRAIVTMQGVSEERFSTIETLEITEAPFSQVPDPNLIVNVNGDEFAVNQVIIELQEDESRATAEALANLVNGTIVGFIPSRDYLLEVPATTIAEQDAIISQLEADPRVLLAIQNTMIDR